MKKGVYNMPNIYVDGKRAKNIYFIERTDEKKDTKKMISQGLTKTCIDGLYKGMNEFAVTIVKSVLQEK